MLLVGDKQGELADSARCGAIAEHSLHLTPDTLSLSLSRSLSLSSLAKVLAATQVTKKALHHLLLLTIYRKT